MNPLIQLPDGTWVRPEDVRAVKSLGGKTVESGISFPPRVVVTTSDITFVVDCDDLGDADRTRDAIAAAVNADGGGTDG